MSDGKAEDIPPIAAQRLPAQFAYFARDALKFLSCNGAVPAKGDQQLVVYRPYGDQPAGGRLVSGDQLVDNRFPQLVIAFAGRQVDYGMDDPSNIEGIIRLNSIKRQPFAHGFNADIALHPQLQRVLEHDRFFHMGIVAGFPLQGDFFHDVGKRRAKLIFVHRLQQVILNAVLQGRFDVREVAVAGKDDGFDRNAAFVDVAKQVDAAQIPHSDVRNQHVIRLFRNHCQRLLYAGGGVYLAEAELLPADQVFQAVQDDLLVIYE